MSADIDFQVDQVTRAQVPWHRTGKRVRKDNIKMKSSDVFASQHNQQWTRNTATKETPAMVAARYASSAFIKVIKRSNDDSWE
ncbi:hypothetical protein M0802_006667 [Mischocyttarus mexicanus]|nr:hypothetical protein M0802_006667 [Mischocyttarus mexicanus]